MQNKVVIPGRVEKENRKKFKVKKDKDAESDVVIEIVEDGDYEVEKLSIEGLPDKMNDGNPIHWINNFSIKKNGQYINQRFFVTLPKNDRNSRIVIFDGNGGPYYYTGEVKNNTIELTDGDPAAGYCP